jgi:hypothetical protein
MPVQQAIDLTGIESGKAKIEIRLLDLPQFEPQ